MGESSAAFREALSHFATGVIVVTAHTPEGPVGFTASAFSSVSLEPALVLVCVGKRASSHAAIVSAPVFGISVLEARQQWIATQFARQGVDRFDSVPLRASARVPLVEGAIAQIECGRHASYDAGDHTILVGEVFESLTATGRPLVYYGRSFGGFTAGRRSPRACGPARSRRNAVASLPKGDRA
jgi:flavin reductase ActVB